MPEQEFGSDGQLHAIDKPAEQPFTASEAYRPSTEPIDIFAASEPGSAAQRLRAFEDEHLGPEAVRIHGDRVERGSGSLFQRMPEHKRNTHAAIEKAVETERKLAAAREAVASAESEHAATLAAAEDASRQGSG